MIGIPKQAVRLVFIVFPDWMADWGFLFGGIVKMELKHLSGQNGYATVGYNGFRHSLKINSAILGNEAQLKRTTRHELGHVLGLLHEHQRWDRDEYLDMTGRPTGGNNYKKN